MWPQHSFDSAHKTKTVYLCGGINGLSDSDANGWRTVAIGILNSHYDILDPMRRDYRGQESGNSWQIVNGDIHDISYSDVVLANVSRPSWGTGMEIFFAHTSGKKIYLFGVERSKASPWLVYHSHLIFEKLEDACAMLVKVAEGC